MIRLDGLSKGFGATRAVDRVDLEVGTGSFLALLGPSGSGKTTLLRLVAGLERPDDGALWINGQAAANMAPGQRGIGFVFQGYALFGHMTVAENIGFGLRVRRRDRPDARAIHATVDRLLHMMRLDGLGARLPAQLSGGQRQRVALARALAVEPRILLLDEPFGALDRQVREELRAHLKRIQAELGITTLFVTHDQEEALSLADRVVILNDGRVVADFAPGDFAHGTLSGFAARFLSRPMTSG